MDLYFSKGIFGESERKYLNRNFNSALRLHFLIGTLPKHALTLYITCVANKPEIRTTPKRKHWGNFSNIFPKKLWQ